jgi:uncharacterized protein (UPF0335 family)
MFNGYVEPELIAEAEENSELASLEYLRNDIENKIESLNEEWAEVTQRIQDIYDNG